MEKSCFLAGGDRRQFWLSRLLAPTAEIFSLGVPGLEDRLPKQAADLLVLPTPCLNGQGRIRSVGDGGLDWSALAGLYDHHTRVYGGALPRAMEKLLPGCGPVTELLEDRTVAAANGRLTAEAALALAEERLEGSVFGLDCTVLGYGRIGKPLAELLAARHARVTVAARRPEVRAEATQRGLNTWDLQGPPPRTGLLFNTVPAPVLKAEALSALEPDCLWMELASAPGGLPAGYEARFSVLNGNSLPGRRLPRSAAAVLLAGILRKEDSL